MLATEKTEVKQRKKRIQEKKEDGRNDKGKGKEKEIERRNG